jgi:hypothetical protein
LFQKSSSAAEIYKVLVKAPKFKAALEVARLIQPCENAVEVLPINKAISFTNTKAALGKK